MRKMKRWNHKFEIAYVKLLEYGINMFLFLLSVEKGNNTCIKHFTLYRPAFLILIFIIK